LKGKAGGNAQTGNMLWPVEHQDRVIERPRARNGDWSAFSRRPARIANDGSPMSGMGFYSTLRKPKSRVDDLAGVVCQEFDVVKAGEGPRHGDCGRTGVLCAPLRLAVHG